MTRRLSLHATQAPSVILPASGELVGGKYRIDNKLGRGGMGAVFAVTHQVTGRRFAIKWLLPTGAEGAQGLKRFVREAQIAGRIRHPNVVDVLDINQEEDGIFLVMELLEGESLSSRLSREGCLDAQEACRIMLPCAAGVAAAHAAGVVHRDIKPANIFLYTRPDGRLQPKVLDFGISQLTAADAMDTTEKRTGTVIGTPYYMAPEQLQAEPCDERVDVYALGVTLYEMLSGKRPFEGVSYAELLLKILRGEPKPLATLVPELPPGLVAVVARAMHHERQARYANVDALIAALSPFAADGGVAAAAVTADRSRGWILPLAAGAVLALGSAVWIYTQPAAGELQPKPSLVKPLPATSVQLAQPQPSVEPPPVAPPPSTSEAPPPLAAEPAVSVSISTAPAKPRAPAVVPAAADLRVAAPAASPRASTPTTTKRSRKPETADIAVDETPTPTPTARTPRLSLSGL